MKMNNKILKPILFTSAVVVLCIIVGLIVCSNDKSNVEYTTETAKENFTYTVLGESIIIDSYIGEETEVIVPAKIDGIIVNSIGPNAFANKNIVSVVLPDSITTINISAFSGCKELTKIKLPESLEFLAAYTFFNCENLEKINIPDKVSIVCVSTFEGCTNLKSVDLGENLTEIGERAFRGTSVENISLPQKISIIRPYAFADCKNLVKVNVPSSLISITDTSFDYENISFDIDNNESIKTFIDKMQK